MADDGGGAATKTAGKTGEFVQKHKKAIYWTAGIVAAIVLYLVIRGYSGGGSTTAANSAGAAGTSGIGTNPYAGGGFSGGLEGPAGPAGATGPAGPRGKQGKPGKDSDKGKRTDKTGRHHGPKRRVGHIPATTHHAAQTTTAARTTHYTVKPGETSASVAAKHGTDISTLHAMNGVGAQRSVHPGQRVRVR
jgi:LysM repeat protein